MSAFYRRLAIKVATYPTRRTSSHSRSVRFCTYFTSHNRIGSWNPRLPLGPRGFRGSHGRDILGTTIFFSSDTTTGESSRAFPHLQSPTSEDAHELFLLMDSRPGCLLTTLLDEKNSNDNCTGSLEKYNVDWTGHYRGFASIVVRPQSTEEVSRILRYCNGRRIGVVPQGGNTGLVGGSIPISSEEIVLSLEKMNNIEKDDDEEITVDAGSVLRADAGCILQDLQDHAAKNECLVPVDLGAKGTCQIGGNVSTNAGGVYYYRYGSLHANVLGLEVVTPIGDILNLGYSPVSHMKDNTGYDLKHLFIGGEGTLGVVTKVALRCQPIPISRGAIWLSCASLMDVVQILTIARTKKLNEILAAFEFMDGDVLQLVRNTHSSIRFPVDISSSAGSATSEEQYSILLETHGSNYDHDREKLESFLELLFEEGLVTDGAMAQNLSQIEDFWNVRELCNPASAATGTFMASESGMAQ
jgi:FAD/FMN-containing dehydrogenase